MTISDTEKLDFLWKKVIYGVGKTALSTNKAASGETIPSSLPVYASNIWSQTDSSSIPATPPGSDTSVIKTYLGSNRIKCTNDPTSASNVAWLATSSFGNTATRMTDFIPQSFGASYQVQVFVGDPNTKAAVIRPDTTGFEYTFDYNAGVLTFTAGIPSGLTATIGSGTVSVATDGIYIEVYQYIGKKGGAGGVNVVADITARDALSPSTGDYVHVLDASGNPSDAAAGEWADYLWNGSAWTLIATQDSARSDNLTSSVALTAASTGTISLGNVGNGARVVEVSVEVTADFDGDLAISVGDDTDNSRLMGADQNDLQNAGAYVTSPIYQFPTNQETAIAIYVTGTATVGNANVIVTYA